MCLQSDATSCKPHRRRNFRLHYRGGLRKVIYTHSERLAEVVGAPEPFEHFKKVSGVPATKAAIEKLNARLAARGALPRAADASAI